MAQGAYVTDETIAKVDDELRSDETVQYIARGNSLSATYQGSTTDFNNTKGWPRLVEQCELVMYNQRSHEEGNQLDIDVIGVDNTEDGNQIVYTCEVVTHIDGLHYSGTPNTDRWEAYGNADYQHTLERLWQKFTTDKEYVTDLFDADSYVFQFWSPVVRGNRDETYLLTGLYDLADEFEAEMGAELELVINEGYTERMDALREKAGRTEKDYGELGFRILQILEHLR